MSCVNFESDRVVVPSTLSQGSVGRFGTVHFCPVLNDPALDLGN